MNSQNTIPVSVILARMEILLMSYRIPKVTNDNGQVVVEYQWTSDLMEREYNQLVQALAISSKEE